MLSSGLSDFNEIDETALALFETCDDSFIGELWEVLVLDHEVVEIVSEVVGTGSATVSIEDSKEAYLRPLNVQMSFAFRFQDVQDD